MIAENREAVIEGFPSEDATGPGSVFTKNVRDKSRSEVENLGVTPKKNGCVSLKFRTPILFY